MPWSLAGYECWAVDLLECDARSKRDPCGMRDVQAKCDLSGRCDGWQNCDDQASRDELGRRDIRGRCDVPASCDIQHVVADVRTWIPPFGYADFVMAWMPCTHLSGVGASSWESKGSAALLEALAIVDACLRIAVRLRPRWWSLENPVGRLCHYLGQPDHVFHPWEYGGWLNPAGDAYTKQTCLWTGGDFVMPEKRPVEPLAGSLLDIRHDAEGRSVTPRGFSLALAAANGVDVDTASGVAHLGRDVISEVQSVGRCLNCGRSLEGRRDRRTCSDRCRAAMSRRARMPRPTCPSAGASPQGGEREEGESLFV